MIYSTGWQGRQERACSRIFTRADTAYVGRQCAGHSSPRLSIYAARSVVNHWTAVEQRIIAHAADRYRYFVIEDV